MTARGGVIGIAAVAAVLLTGCGGESQQLEALKNDPFASYEPPGGRLVRASGLDQGTSLGKPVQADYTRLFELRPGDPERQLEHALAAAAAAGWTVDNDRVYRSVNDALVQQGERRLSTGRARFAVTLFPRGAPGRDTHAPAMFVHLEHAYSLEP